VLKSSKSVQALIDKSEVGVQTLLSNVNQEVNPIDILTANLQRQIQNMVNPDLIVYADHSPIFRNTDYYIDGYLRGSEFLSNFSYLISG
jgi:hypothetical protein